MSIKIDQINSIMDSGFLTATRAGSYISKIRARYLSERLIDIFYSSNPKTLLTIMEESNFEVKDCLEKVTEVFLKQESKVMPDNKIKTTVRGELTYNQLVFGSKVYKVYPTKRFDWSPGDYGDFNSCYWQSKAGAKDMILNEGGFALKFHQDGDRLGRCWAVFLPKLLESDNEPLLIFNAYTNLGIGNALEYFADMLQKTMGYKNYIKVELWNNGGRGNNTLFINKNEGILLTDWTTGKDGFKIDLRWKEAVNIPCALCRRLMKEENAFSVEDRLVCENCLTNEVFPCFACGEFFFNRNGQKVTEEGIERRFCFNCLGDLFGICRHDNKMYRRSDLIQVDYGDFCAKVNIDKMDKVKICECKSYNHKRRDWCWSCGAKFSPKIEEKKKKPKRAKVTEDNVADLFDFQKEVMDGFIVKSVGKLVDEELQAYLDHEGEYRYGE